MPTNLITTIFSILGALLLFGSVAAFFLQVPAIGAFGTVLILISLLLMFTLGVYAGGRRIRIRRHL